jgi:hypothetical protein
LPGNASSLTARLLNNASGNITLTGTNPSSNTNGMLIGANTNIFAGGTLAVTSKLKALTTGGTLVLSSSVSGSAKTITINGSGVNIGAGVNFASINNTTINNTNSAGNLLIGDNVQLLAGALIPGPNPPAPPATGNLQPTQIASKGALTLSTNGQGTQIGNSDSFTSNGGDLRLTVTAVAGALTVGTNNQFVANGGNIFIFAKDNITGSTGNFFHARSVGTAAANSTGGGIEVGSGLTTSTNLLSALNLKLPQANPSANALGVGVVYNNTVPNPGTTGIIKANVSTGTVNLTHNGGPASLNLQSGGAQVFDAQGGTTVQFDGATFQTEGLKPIAMTSTIDSEQDSTTPLMLENSGSDTTAISVGDRNAQLRLLELADGTSSISSVDQETLQSRFGSKLNAQLYAKPQTNFLYANNKIRLTKGELFVNATSASVELKTDAADIQAGKGALVSVRTLQGSTYVKSCSGSSTVNVIINGKTFALNTGEELLVTDHKPDDSEIHPADGIGRRQTSTSMAGRHYVTISDFAIITMLSQSDALAQVVHASDSESKRLLNSILKRAAAVDTVMKYRGAYSAK